MKILIEVYLVAGVLLDEIVGALAGPNGGKGRSGRRWGIVWIKGTGG